MNSPKCLLPDFVVIFSKIVKITILEVRFNFYLETCVRSSFYFSVLLYIPSPIKHWGFAFQSGLFNTVVA